MKCKNKLFWDATEGDQEDEAATTKTRACFLLFFARPARSSTYERSVALRQKAPLWKAQLRIISCTMAPCDSGLPIYEHRRQSDLLLSKYQIIGSPEDVIGFFFLCRFCRSCPLYTVCVNFGSHCFKCHVTDGRGKNKTQTHGGRDRHCH